MEINGKVSLKTEKPYTRHLLTQSFGEGSEAVSEILLPEEWNGIFIGRGNGGLAGRLDHELLVRYAQEGYAVAQSDMGTANGRARGIGCSEVHKDFGWRATHEMTVAAKALIKEKYGRDPLYSYFIGASTGGQQSLMLAQRYPEDYDGIIAGVPANNRVFLHTYFLWNHNALVSPEGKPRFDEAEVSYITECAVRFFQQNGDGQRGDNFITFPWLGDDTVGRFIDFLRSENRFTEDQLSALYKVYDGAKDPKSGRRIYNGMPIGSEKFGCGIMHCQREEAPHYYPFVWTFGEGYNGDGFDFSDDLASVDKLLSGELNASSCDLTAFGSRGGKLIVFSGSADPCVPYPDAIRYCERVNAFHGGYEKTGQFFRYFLLPGRDHGVGGDGANAESKEQGGRWDLLDALRDWREKGEAPEYLTAKRYENGELKWSRRVYPYLSENFPKRELPPTCDETFLK